MEVARYLNKIIWGDCLDVMNTMPNNSIDLIITDPPYGLHFKNKSWDKNIPQWFDIAHRLSENIIFTTAPTTMWNYPRPDWVNCWYREASNSRTAQGGFNHWSPMLIYGTIKFKVDSLKLHAIVNAQPRGYPHPSPKPLNLLRWIIKEASSPNSLILDPFLGSGTTMVACHELNRRCIGIEKELKYVGIARRRLQAVTAQGRLFEPVYSDIISDKEQS